MPVKVYLNFTIKGTIEREVDTKENLTEVINSLSDLNLANYYFRIENVTIRKHKVHPLKKLCDLKVTKGETITTTFNIKDKIKERNPKNLSCYKTITNEAYSNNKKDCFSVFKSFQEDNLMIYSTQKNEIVCYCLDSESIILKLKNLHKSDNPINQVRYYPDIKARKDYLLTSNIFSGEAKVWNIYQNFQCVYTFNKNVNKLDTALLFSYEKNTKFFLMTRTVGQVHKPKVILDVYEFNANPSSNNPLSNYYHNHFYRFLDVFYNYKDNKNYLINYEKKINIFNFEEDDLLFTFGENHSGTDYKGVFVFEIKGEFKIFAIENSHIYIYSFENGLHLDTIESEFRTEFTGNTLTLWNEDYLLFAAYEGGYIKYINLNTNEVEGRLDAHNCKYYLGFRGYKGCTSVRKIFLSNYGNILISIGDFDAKIKMWIVK